MFLFSFVVLPSDVGFEIVETWPPLASCTIAGVRARSADIADFVPYTWRGAVNRLSVTLEVILRREALGSSAARLATTEGLRVLKMVLPVFDVRSHFVNHSAHVLTVHQMDSSIPCRTSGKVERMIWT